MDLTNAFDNAAALYSIFILVYSLAYWALNTALSLVDSKDFFFLFSLML